MNKSLVLAAIVAAVALAACGKKEEAVAPAPVVVTPEPVVVAPEPAPAASAPADAASAPADAAAAPAPTPAEAVTPATK